jgi:uncharacterized membrane protein
MTTARQILNSRRIEPTLVAGSAIVLLLALAGLLNLLLARRSMPSDFRDVSIVVHLVTVLLAVPLGAAQLIMRKGGLRHRVMGYTWLGLMTVTALVSFAIHTINPGGFSPIHALSTLTLVMVPVIAVQARRRKIENHRRAALFLVAGALVIAGFFTFIPGRVLGDLLFGTGEAGQVR